MTIRIALGIPHTPWVPERVESMQRLRKQLNSELRSDEKRIECDIYREFTDREANHQWSARMWEWAVQTGCTHFLQLQDDVQVAPNFWAVLHAMLEVVPDEVIALETVHPATRALAADGHRWFTTADGLVGVAYVIPIPMLENFLEWRQSALVDGAVEAITEDNLIDLWLLRQGLRAWHPIPTIVDHDVRLASTYGNDGHSNRRPLVRWDTPALWHHMTDDLTKAPWLLANPPHLGRFYDGTPDLACRWIKDFSPADYARVLSDNGRAELRKLANRMRVRSDERPKARVLICTPTRGAPSAHYASTLVKLAIRGECEITNAWEIYGIQQRDADLVRTRSRLVRLFLESDATHLFFIDDDVSFEPVVLEGMLAAGRDFVAAPYPRRESVDLERIVSTPTAGVPHEARAYRYNVGLQGELRLDERSCAQVEWMPLGCALLSRACLERMLAHTPYAEELTFLDCYEGRAIPTVALFQLSIVAGELLSEDRSFCGRWRALEEPIYMYLGRGSPVTHHGEYAFRGHPEAFGIRHL